MSDESLFFTNKESVPEQEVTQEAAAEQPRLPSFEITHELVKDLVEGHSHIFETGRLLGLYLGGSLATGDFDENTSDLDFLTVIGSAVTDREIEQLRELHQRIRLAGKNRLYANYEGEYLTREQALDPKAAGPETLHLGSDGHLDLENAGAGLIIELWKIRSSGFTVIGPPPEELLADIRTDEMVQANTALFSSWWRPKLERHESMDDEYQVYAVLTMVRVLFTLTNGGIASKKQAALWCAESFPRYAALIHEARAWQPGMGYGHQDEVYSLIDLVNQQVGSSEVMSSQTPIGKPDRKYAAVYYRKETGREIRPDPCAD